MDDEDLSEQQVAQILRDASYRLRSRSSLSESGSLVEASKEVANKSHKNIASVSAQSIPSSYIKSTNSGAKVDSRRTLTNIEKEQSNGFRRVEDAVYVKDKTSKKPIDAGSRWFNLPRTKLTPELKRDLQLLRMRSVLDPKRHYRKQNGNGVPEFSAIGTIIEGPTDYFARLTKKEQKRTLVDEVLETEKSSGRFKRKYNDIQRTKTSGKKAYYKALKLRRASKNLGG